MRKRQIRLNYLSFTLALEEMLTGAFTAKALSEHSGMSHRYLCALLRTMHEKRVVHISGWEKDSIGRCAVRVYTLGPGRDAKRPVKTRQEVNRRYRARAANAPLIGTPFYGLAA